LLWCIETLEQRCHQAEAKCAALSAELERLKLRNRELELRLSRFIKRFLGKKSEKIDPRQLELLFDSDLEKPQASDGPAPEEAVSNQSEQPVRPTRRRGGHRSRIIGLDQIEEQVEEIIPDMVEANPQDYERIGEETSEVLDYIPSKLVRRRIIRGKYRLKAQRHLPPVVAPAPLTPLLGGLPSAALLAYLLNGKYIDHLPLYRLQGILARMGVTIPRDLIIHWIHQAIGILEAVANAIREQTLSQSYIQVDETPVRYLKPGNGKACQGYLWVVNAPGRGLYYHWGVERSTDELCRAIGEHYEGTLQCDAYSAYTSYQKRQPEKSGLSLGACLAHIRRNFVDILDDGWHRDAALMVHLMGLLYGIEKHLREKLKAGPGLRHSVRAWQSAPVYHRIGKVIDILLPRYRPSDPMCKALSYAKSNWKRIGEYLRDGRVEIDNNLAENAVRPIKLGAKNWLFFGSEGAGHNAALIYTIVENCRRHNLHPEQYLAELLTKLAANQDPEYAATLTPARIAQARARKSSAA